SRGWCPPRPPESAALSGGDGAIGPDSVRWVQMALNQILGLGLAVDGILGPRTRNALLTFQQTRGLPTTGIPDQSTSQGLVMALAGAPAATSACTRLQAKEILDNFDQGKADVKPSHQRKISAIALCVRDSERTSAPIRLISLVGHASTEGEPSFNEALGQ